MEKLGDRIIQRDGARSLSQLLLPRERRTGLEEARKETELEPGLPILIGTPNPEREVWILNGFVAKSDSESRRLEQVKNRLGFDPTQQPHRLRSDRRRIQSGCRAGYKEEV